MHLNIKKNDFNSSFKYPSNPSKEGKVLLLSNSELIKNQADSKSWGTAWFAFSRLSIELNVLKCSVINPNLYTVSILNDYTCIMGCVSGNPFFLIFRMCHLSISSKSLDNTVALLPYVALLRFQPSYHDTHSYILVLCNILDRLLDVYIFLVLNGVVLILLA